MKLFNSEIRQLFAAVALVAGSSLASPLGAQLANDSATGIPQLMVVESVNMEAGTVTLNGDVYRVNLEKRPTQATLSVNGRSLKLSDLEPGMEILVSTDGTEPGRSNSAQVLSMWDPD